MAANLEIKASLPATESAALRALALGAEHAGELHQIDVYFRTSRGRLKLRTINGAQAELISYERDEQADQRLSLFERLPVEDPERLKRMLGAALGIRGVVEKQRTLWMYGRTRIHIDDVKNLGCFLEIEVPVTEGSDSAQTTMETLLEGFQIAPEAYIRSSYIDLIAGQG